VTSQHYYSKEVTTISGSAGACDAAEKLESEGVGCVVVVDEEQRPLGMLTDRDLALRVVAAGKDPDSTTVEMVMSQPVVSLEASAPLSELIHCMSRHGIRRVPVVQNGRLVGIASLDDLMLHLGRAFDDLAQAAERQLRDAQRSARIHKLRDDLEGRFDGLVEQLETFGSQTRDAITRELGALKERLRRGS
jgi:CBS domain-containing protein